MGVAYAPSAIRFIYCSHRHDDGEPCNEGCVHSVHCDGFEERRPS